jgi:flagellar motor protein MotB
MGKAKEKVKIVINFGCPEWMLTMGDCMSLLLCFFVLMLTFSTPQKDKLMEAISGMQGALSLFEPVSKKPITKYQKADDVEDTGSTSKGGFEEIKIKKDNMSVVSLRSLKIFNKFSEFREKLMDIGFDKFVSAQQLKDGIFIEAEFDRVFAPGLTEILPEAYPLLESFANLCGSVGNQVNLTAAVSERDVPDGTRHSAAWFLSQKRIGAIGDILQKKYGVPRSRLDYSFEFRPDSGEGGKLKMALMEKLGVSQVNMVELINLKQDI